MALSDELEALAKRHGALSYRNRADTQNPAFGFSVAGLESLLVEVRKRDEALIRQCRAALAEELAARLRGPARPPQCGRAGDAPEDGRRVGRAAAKPALQLQPWRVLLRMRHDMRNAP